MIRSDCYIYNTVGHVPPTPVQPWSAHLGEINLESIPTQLLSTQHLHLSVYSSMGSVSELLLVKPKSSCMCDAALCEEHCNSYCQDSACLAVSSGAVHMNTTS